MVEGQGRAGSSATNTPVSSLLIDTPATTLQSTHLQPIPCNQLQHTGAPVLQSLLETLHHVVSECEEYEINREQLKRGIRKSGVEIYIK